MATALPVLLIWAADGRSGSGPDAALRTAGQVWLVAHGAGLALPGGQLGLTPLGLLLLPLALLLRAGGHSARESRVGTWRDALLLAAAVGMPYGVLAAVVASLCRTSQVQPVAWQALLGGVVVGMLGALAGILQEAGLWRSSWAALPVRLRRVALGTAAALGVLIAAGALLTGLSLSLHLGRAARLGNALSPGVVGGVALLVISLLLVPNLAVWGLAWLAGPGFHVGVATTVGPYGTILGPVPGLPLLAALPGPVPVWVGPLASCVPFAAGALAGLLVCRRLTQPSWLVAAREAALTGPGAGLVAAAVGWGSGGSAGGGRLLNLGPSPWQLGLALTGEVGLGAAVTAGVLAGLAARRVRA